MVVWFTGAVISLLKYPSGGTNLQMAYCWLLPRQSEIPPLFFFDPGCNIGGGADPGCVGSIMLVLVRSFETFTSIPFPVVVLSSGIVVLSATLPWFPSGS